MDKGGVCVKTGVYLVVAICIVDYIHLYFCFQLVFDAWDWWQLRQKDRRRKVKSVRSSEKRSKMSGQQGQRRVGLLYDERMCKHHSEDDDFHPETPNRIRAIWNKLQTSRITDR